MLATKQNISAVIDDCDLYEDGLLIVAARRHSIAWYSRDPITVIRPAGEINVVLPYTHGHGAIIADGIFAYISALPDGIAQCVIVDRNRRAVRMIEPAIVEHINASTGQWHYVGTDRVYTGWGYWAMAAESRTDPSKPADPALTTPAITVVALDMSVTGAILSGRGHQCVIGAAETSDIILRDVTGAEADRVFVPACTPPITVWWLHGGAVYIGSDCELTDKNRRTLRFDRPAVSVWDSPDGPVAVDAAGDAWSITTSDAIPGTKYENYEWLWYAARHGDWIALDVSGRAVSIA